MTRSRPAFRRRPSTLRTKPAWTFGLTACVLCCSSAASAQSSEGGTPAVASDASTREVKADDRFELSARSDTHLLLFRRALLPGARGAIVTTETELPVVEYAAVEARDIDAAWQADAIDVSFAAWGRLWPTPSNLERPFDGDVQAANVRLEGGPVWVRAGRQQVAGGAARFARFDGASVGAVDPLGLFAQGYAGYVVLPRWDARPGYHHLGSGEGRLLEDPEDRPQRSAHWLAGARAGYQSSRVAGSLSFHEQRETGGLSQRNLGLDVGGQPSEETSAGGSALFELDSRRFATLRAWIDARPHDVVDLSADFQRAEPALLLSRQSVLSVFSTTGYDELGGSVGVRVRRWLRLEADGHGQIYDEGRPGARSEVASRFFFDRGDDTLVRLAYARVLVPGGGYHSLRATLARELSRSFSSTLEAYGYFYDTPIRGLSTSSVYSATLSYRALETLALLWGGSLAQSPYAALDAQTLVRASYTFDLADRGRMP